MSHTITDISYETVVGKAKLLINEEIEALRRTKDNIGEAFFEAVNTLLKCEGKVVITGIGKSGHAARKMSATMVSLGIEAAYMNPADAIHGDLGLIRAKDVVIPISKSGESQEILTILPFIKNFGAKIIGITSNPQSSLASYSDVVLQIGVEKEAGHLNLAPTSSVLATLAIGDALATVVAELKGFKEEHFAIYHPGGAIGARLTLKVEDLLSDQSYSAVQEDESFKRVIVELTEKRLGATVVMRGDRVTGIITDGDLKRVLDKYQENSFALTAAEIMTPHPVAIQKSAKVSQALELMEQRERPISVLPVLDGAKYIGILRIHDILKIKK